MKHESRAVGGRIMTVPFTILLAFGLIGLFLIGLRFVLGLGATTNLSAGYPWGLWIAFDVVTGTALACGGYAMALMVYVFNRGKYHPLIRPAILTSALGYSIAAISIAIDVGRPWELWKVPLMLWRWNVNSVLLEVAVCMMAYTFVLWLELAPAMLDRWRESSHPRLRRIAVKSTRFFDRALLWIIGLGILLPTMHQSSLGSLILLSGPRLNPLWNTSLLPAFFLLTALAMGYAMVVFESAFSHHVFGRKPDLQMLVSLQKAAAWGAAIFVAFRIFDVVARGAFAHALRFDRFAVMFWLESALFLSPLVFMFVRGAVPKMGSLVREAMVVAFAGALYRFDAFLLAFDPGPGWAYFPSLTETFVTVGLVSLEVAGYIALVKVFPILGGLPHPVTGPRRQKAIKTHPAPSPAH
jgi:Ni/Fe-hydrogenase subunit HybB-like protein